MTAYICKPCETVTFDDPLGTFCLKCKTPFLIYLPKQQYNNENMDRYFDDIFSEITQLEDTVARFQRALLRAKQ